MAELPDELRHALADRLAGESSEALRSAVGRLMSAYRAGGPAGGGALAVSAGGGAAPGQRVSTPVLSGRAEIAAYAAYRMPATYAAVRAVFAAVPWWEPASLVDVGGGTGAVAWAATDAYRSLQRITVLDQVEGAMRLGADLAAASGSVALRSATWQRTVLPGDVPAADLVTISYVLGELGEAVRREVVNRAAGAGGAVVIVEPGTPAGYARIIDARDRLLSLGHRIVAPCPHQLACPLAAGDWCHFGARVNRSALHRRIKGADLSYEDEKFAYVATVARPPTGLPVRSDEARVIRRPTQRKGLVALRLCTPDGATKDRNVTKRDPALYRRARDTAWGDSFPA
jgi:ribosomal protein RSM22 (predicted rRNA methylase)